MLHDMGGEKHGRPGGMLGADNLFQRLLIDRVETGKGLVQDQEIRIVGQGGEDLDLLGHTLGKLGDLCAGKLSETRGLQQFIGPRIGLAGRQPLQAREIGHRLARGHLLVEPALFRQETDPAQGGQFRLLPEQGHRTFIGGHDAERHAQAGGLAGPVGPEKADNRTRRNLKAQPVDGSKSAEPFGRSGQDEGRLCHGRSLHSDKATSLVDKSTPYLSNKPLPNP